MNSLPLKLSMGYKGDATGTAANSTLTATLIDVVTCSLTGSGKQAYIGTTTLAVSGNATLNLLSGLTNPLGEAIAAFGHVFGVLIEHDSASLATAGITVFGGGSNDFQGPLSALATATLTPGQAIAFLTPASGTGWATSGTVKNIKLVNLDATALHTATVNVSVFGTTA